MAPQGHTGYALWINDMRDPEDFLRGTFVDRYAEFRQYADAGWEAKDFIWSKSADAAIQVVKHFGVPSFVALDHDLGYQTIFVFLRWMSTEHMLFPPQWMTHSANPAGVDNINSFMRTWHKTWGKDREL